ncbi:hypothetical protein HY409_00615 [Candidatus Gottesmanbacteria bacterium]|nr:hypothetical protein [Candidatus Gottesmanbacteria bacterium]
MTIATTVFATESTPSALPSKEASDSSRQKQIDNLKERLATKVAELRQTQKRAISGTVKNTSITTITIETNTKDVKIERNDDIQVYQMLKGKRTKLSTDDVEKGDFIVVFGDYDTTLDILKAKVIFIQSLPLLRIWGSIKDIDKNNFTVTITTKEEREIVIDIEKSTKVTLWTKSQGVEKSGFSKLATFDVIHILGSAVPKKENRISAGRILSLGNLTNPSITPTSTPEIGASPTLP